MADNIPLTLFCLIDGDSVSKGFKLKNISPSEDVDDLRNSIFEGNQAAAFGGIAAKDLILWCASIPDDKKGSAITIDALDDKTELNNPRVRLSKLFPESPDENTYIIVQRPPPGNACCNDGLSKTSFT